MNSKPRPPLQKLQRLPPQNRKFCNKDARFSRESLGAATGTGGARLVPSREALDRNSPGQPFRGPRQDVSGPVRSHEANPSPQTRMLAKNSTCTWKPPRENASPAVKLCAGSLFPTLSHYPPAGYNSTSPIGIWWSSATRLPAKLCCGVGFASEDRTAGHGDSCKGRSAPPPSVRTVHPSPPLSVSSQQPFLPDPFPLYLAGQRVQERKPAEL